MNIKIFTLLSLIALSTPGHAYTIDGNWNDWVTLSGQGSDSDWIPIDSSVKYTIEDQDTSYLNPGYGGQDYDAEAIYVNRDSTDIYVAVITGRDPNASGWRWGDIALDFGNDGVFEYGLVTLGDSGQHSSSGIGDSGNFYQVNDWNVGIWDAPRQNNPSPTTAYALQHPTSILAGNLLGAGEFAYSAINGPVGSLGGDHFFMEARIPLALINPALLNQAFTAHWTMGCANDWIQVDPVPPGNVPEPGLPLLLLAGITGMITSRRKNTSHP
jgi:hypothetical protein